jgi:hypothetical protein
MSWAVNSKQPQPRVCNTRQTQLHPSWRSLGRQDGTLRQAGYSTNTMKSSEAEKLEKVIKRPSLTLVGMSTPSEFLQAIGGGDVASGLLNRFIIVRSEIGVQMSQEKRRSAISDRLAVWAKEHAHAHEGDLDAGIYMTYPHIQLKCRLLSRQSPSCGSMNRVWSMPSRRKQAQVWRPCTIAPEKYQCVWP